MGTVGPRCPIMYYSAQPFRFTSQRASSIGQPEEAPLYAVVPPARGGTPLNHGYRGNWILIPNSIPYLQKNLIPTEFPQPTEPQNLPYLYLTSRVFSLNA